MFKKCIVLVLSVASLEVRCAASSRALLGVLGRSVQVSKAVRCIPKGVVSNPRLLSSSVRGSQAVPVLAVAQKQEQKQFGVQDMAVPLGLVVAGIAGARSVEAEEQEGVHQEDIQREAWTKQEEEEYKKISAQSYLEWLSMGYFVDSPKYFLEKIRTFEEEKRSSFAVRYLEDKWDGLDAGDVRRFLDFLSEPVRKKYAIKCLEDKWDSLAVNDVGNFLDCLSEPVTEKYAIKYLEDKWDSLAVNDVENFLYFLSEPVREKYAIKFLEDKWDGLNGRNSGALLGYIKDEKYLCEYLLIDEEQDSLSTKHLKANLQNLLNNLRNVKPEIRELSLEMMEYQYEQEKQDRVVYFHGQAWGWQQYAQLYRALYEVKEKLENDYQFLRFSKDIIFQEREQIIAQKGVSAFKDARKDLLFTNRSLFANNQGSNTVDYVEGNWDQSVTQNRNQQEFERLFKELGYEKVFEKLEKEKPELLEKYSELHAKASQFGNFIVITMPRETAEKISYCAEVGGPKLGSYDRYEGANTVPFEHQYCIVLGPTILDPVKAKQAGIEITNYNAADPEIMAQRDAVLAEIVEFVRQA